MEKQTQHSLNPPGCEHAVFAERSLLLDVFILLTQSEHNQTLWKAPGVMEETSGPAFFIQNHTVGYLDERVK